VELVSALKAAASLKKFVEKAVSKKQFLKLA
jgi:hypothetical protein